MHAVKAPAENARDICSISIATFSNLLCGANLHWFGSV